jgi:hypothetical protein
MTTKAVAKGPPRIVRASGSLLDVTRPDAFLEGLGLE